MFKKSSVCGFGGCVEVDINPQAGPIGFSQGQASRAGIGGFSGDTKVGEETVLIRKSDRPDVLLIFSTDEWKLFIVGVKKGEFDVP